MYEIKVIIKIFFKLFLSEKLIYYLRKTQKEKQLIKRLLHIPHTVTWENLKTKLLTKLKIMYKN